MPISKSVVRPFPDCPLVVAYGLGVDSTAMLIEFAKRGIRPDHILFADTGGEKPETYQYLDVIRPFLAHVGFPNVVVVRYQPKWATYQTLEEQCLHTGTLPSLAYGGKSCSLKYKRTPQDKFILSIYPVSGILQRNQRIVRAIGFEAGEERRTYAHSAGTLGQDAYKEHQLMEIQLLAETKKPLSREQWLDQHYFAYWYPLLEWGYDREKCKTIIAQAGLPVPLKSSCFFCPASKKKEILWLQEQHPELLERALTIERNAQEKLTSVKGLGRSFSWVNYLVQRDDLPLFSSPASYVR